MKKAMEPVVLVKLNRKAEGKELTKKYEMRGAPGFLLMDTEGKVITAWLGYSSKEKFIETLKKGLEEAKGP